MCPTVLPHSLHTAKDNATNLTKGVEYWFTVQAKDSLGYLSDVSPPLFFILDGMCIIRLKMIVYL